MSYRTGIHPSLDAELELPSPIRSCPHSEIECEPCETDRLDAPYIAQANGRLAMSFLQSPQRIQQPAITYLVVRREDVQRIGVLSVDVACLDNLTTARDAAKTNDSFIIVPTLDLNAVMNGKLTYNQVMLQLERMIFQAALSEEQGSPTRAARRLGMSHPRLTAALKARHPEIKRTPIKKRSVMKK